MKEKQEKKSRKRYCINCPSSHYCSTFNLAGVSITVLFGDSGIITMAEKKPKKQKRQQKR